MTARALFRKDDLARALRVAREAGQTVRRCTITAEGIELEFGQPAPADDFDLIDMRRKA